MYTVGRVMDTGEIVIRNLDNGDRLRIDPDPEDFEMFVEMLVDELNDLNPRTEYLLETLDTGEGEEDDNSDDEDDNSDDEDES